MNETLIDQIKADAFAYVMGMPFVASSYLAYNDDELKVWEDGLAEAVEFRDATVPDELDPFTETDGDQEMDLYLPMVGWDDLKSPETYGLDIFAPGVDWSDLEYLECH